MTLIDAAMPNCAEEILHAAVEIGKSITKIVLTHAHHDHIGALDKLKNALPKVPVYISRREARLLAGDRTLDAHEPNEPIRGVIPKNIQTQPDILLGQGDCIGSLLALEVPGHTPGSMAFLDTRNKALIAGDTFQTEGGVAVAGQLRPSFPFPSLGTWSKRTAYESARKLLEYNPTLLAVGHGKMLSQPMDAMELAITDAMQNLNHAVK